MSTVSTHSSFTQRFSYTYVDPLPAVYFAGATILPIPAAGASDVTSVSAFEPPIFAASFKSCTVSLRIIALFSTCFSEIDSLLTHRTIIVKQHQISMHTKKLRGHNSPRDRWNQTRGRSLQHPSMKLRRFATLNSSTPLPTKTITAISAITLRRKHHHTS